MLLTECPDETVYRAMMLQPSIQHSKVQLCYQQLLGNLLGKSCFKTEEQGKRIEEKTKKERKRQINTQINQIMSPVCKEGL